jgi:hypothetical protein
MSDWFREFFEQRVTDPQAFYLMCGCISLIVFLACTIFFGFLWYLYGWGKPKSKPDASKATVTPPAESDNSAETNTNGR